MLASFVVAAKANPYLCALAAWLLLSAINGALVHYHKAPAVTRWLSVIVDRLSLLTRSNSPGTLKWPMLASALPPEAQKAVTVASAIVEASKGGGTLAILLPLALTSMFTSACATESPWTIARQSLAGGEIARSATARVLDSYDQTHERDLAVACTTSPCKALVEYRTSYDVARKALTAFDAALAAGELGVNVAEQAANKDVLGTIVAAIGPPSGDLVKALDALGVPVPSALLSLIPGGRK